MAKALLVIDLQEGYIEKYPPLLLTRVNERIQRAAADKELTVYVKNTKRLKNSRKTNELAGDLNICSAYILCKETASAFSNPELQEILRQNQITEIEIAGIDGNSCIASTAMASVQNGYKTILQYDCIGVQNVKRFEKTEASLLEKGVAIVPSEMKDVVLLFDTACIYEIAILNYFLKLTGSETVFCSLTGEDITSTEGYSLKVSAKLSELNTAHIRILIVPGGDVSPLKDQQVYGFLKSIKEKGNAIAAICAGVDVLEKAGVLEGLRSIRSTDLDVARDQHVITARANAYVDFAIEVGKELALFDGEEDLLETINFWKFHKRV